MANKWSQEDHIRRVMITLEKIDDLIIEAALDAIFWHQNSNTKNIRHFYTGQDVTELINASAGCHSDLALQDMLRYLEDLPKDQKLLDNTITFVIAVLQIDYVTYRPKWKDWYWRVEKAEERASSAILMGRDAIAERYYERPNRQVLGLRSHYADLISV
jgi:hypothetical protein